MSGSEYDVQTSDRGIAVLEDQQLCTSSSIIRDGATSGKKVTVELKANYFQLKTGKFEPHKYTVQFYPPVRRPKFRLKLVTQLVNCMPQEESVKFLFDGEDNVYTSGKIEQPHREVRFHDPERDKMIRIKLIDECSVSLYEKEGIRMLNVLKRSLEKDARFPMDRGRYSDYINCVEPLRTMKCLYIHDCYRTNLRQYQSGPLLRVDIRHMLVDRRPLSNITEEYASRLIGKDVLTTYNNKMYRILGYEFLHQNCYFRKSGRNYFFSDYYLDKYKLVISGFPHLCFVAEPKEEKRKPDARYKIMLFSQFCFITGIPIDVRRSAKVMSEIANKTRISPQARVERLMKYRDRIYQSPRSLQTLQNWNLTMGDDLHTVFGEQLSCEEVVFHKYQCNTQQTSDWNHCLSTQLPYISADIQNWLFISPPPAKERSDNDCILEFKRLLKHIAQSYQMELADPLLRRAVDYSEIEIVKICEKVSKDSSVSFILFVLPYKSTKIYEKIKRICCGEFGITTQVVVMKTIRQAVLPHQNAIIKKILMQIIAKQKGVPWNVAMPSDDYMYVGFDISLRDSEGKRFAALVAIMDTDKPDKEDNENEKKNERDKHKKHKLFFSSVERFSDQEYSATVSACMKAALSQYLSKGNKRNPEHIIFYRNAVPEGDLRTVKEIECQAIQSAVSDICGSDPKKKKPGLAFIVVMKHSHTRLFVREDGVEKNPAPGTVVDNDITLLQRDQFYLVSQRVRQGTVMPTLYNVLCHDENLNIKQLQKITYKLTHLYYNWPGVYSVPAVCKYANKLANFVGNVVRGEIHSKLSSYLYYL